MSASTHGIQHASISFGLQTLLKVSSGPRPYGRHPSTCRTPLPASSDPPATLCPRPGTVLHDQPGHACPPHRPAFLPPEGRRASSRTRSAFHSGRSSRLLAYVPGHPRREGAHPEGCTLMPELHLGSGGWACLDCPPCGGRSDCSGRLQFAGHPVYRPKR